MKRATRPARTDTATPTETRWPEPVARAERALDLAPDLFTRKSARAIARTLKDAAESSRTRKGTPLQSAMGALNFILNRSGKNLAPERRATLERAKVELRRLFARETPRTARRRSAAKSRG